MTIQKPKCCLCPEDYEGLMVGNQVNVDTIHFPYIAKGKYAHIECYIKEVIRKEIENVKV